MHPEKKRKKSAGRQIMTVLACLLIFTAILIVAGCAAAFVSKRVATDVATSGSVQEAEITLTQAELEAQIEAAEESVAAEKDAEITAAASEASESARRELLDYFREGLGSGQSSVLELLKPLYPDYIVAVSGGQFHFVSINDSLQKNDYTLDNLNILETGEYQYLQDGQVISHKGIDVSSHQGEIDWEQVAADGVEFAFIRAAYRGYGSGKLVEDEMFESNIEGALAAGIKVGVYVFSQAITEDEVLEEADLVLQRIAPYKIECPVVYDVEMVTDSSGRMNNITVEERTAFTKLFCDTIEAAGYRSMIYHNLEMGALKIDLTQLEDYDKWFAYYNDDFYYPYAYDVWQYSCKGSVAGIDGDVDLNIAFEQIWNE